MIILGVRFLLFAYFGNALCIPTPDRRHWKRPYNDGEDARHADKRKRKKKKRAPASERQQRRMACYSSASMVRCLVFAHYNNVRPRARICTTCDRFGR